MERMTPRKRHLPRSLTSSGSALCWGLVIAQACVVYTAYLLMTWLPTYLQTTSHVSLPRPVT